MDEFAIEMRRKKLLIICAVVVTVILVAVCVVLALSGDKTSATQQPSGQPTHAPTIQPSADLEATIEELLLLETAEQRNMIVVTTNYGTVSYPVAFEELMTVEARNQGNVAALVFSAAVGGQQQMLYELLFNSREGVPIGYLRVGEVVYVVTAVFHEPVGLSEDGMSAFYAAQETFNDVVTALEENPGFMTEKP